MATFNHFFIMIDSKTFLSKAVKHMDEAFHLYEKGEDTFTVAKRLVHLHRMLAKARSTLIWERVETILAKPTLDQKDKETLEELLT